MRIALVSPYSWTYPGGVTRHIEALAEQLLAGGHDVRILAPHDPDDALSARLHRGARPEPRPVPDHVVPLGRTVGLPANGAVSNLAATPRAIGALRTELVTGGYDVVHLHEPVVPVLCWDAAHFARAPLVGTFHTYSANRVTHGAAALLGSRRTMNRLAVRIAVSEAAEWTARRFYGGSYRVIPNGVAVPAQPAVAPAPSDRLRIVFVGQTVERKGLSVLLRAFEALREHVPATLTLVGAAEEEVAPLLMDRTGVRALGKVSDEEKGQRLREADVLCAPSLGGESFGMVLTEAFAAGTPVIASDIAGYRDVVEHGGEGLLVPRGDAMALAEALRELWHDPARRRAMGAAASVRAERFAWPRVAAEVVDAYEHATAASAPEGALRRAAVRVGALPAGGSPREPARRLPSLEPRPGGDRARVLAVARRVGIVVAALATAVLALVALRRIGMDNIAASLLGSSPVWVLVGLAVMCSSMLLRAVSWHAILRAALPRTRVRLVDATQGTLIGVLMSATLPARLGEPSRALIVARRLGRPREHLPVVLGTLASQTLLNILALVLLGGVMLSTVGIFGGRHGTLLLFTVAPLALVLGVILAPALLRGAHGRRLHPPGWLRQARNATAQIRSGLRVFRSVRLGAMATGAQLSAWGLQWIACYVLLVALGLDHVAGLGAAAAVLFAVNVTAVLPATPSNLGVFQAACVAVLSGGYGISSADALGFGIVLQAVEVTTAVIMGMPALVKEGVSWRDVRVRALHASPVTLPQRAPRPVRDALEAEA